MNQTPLTFSELKLGMRVVDIVGDAGFIESCEDSHNINVIFDNGGAGLYCLHEDCEEFEPLLFAE